MPRKSNKEVKMKNSFLTWREWLYMKKGLLKWYFKTLGSKSKFTGFEVFNNIQIKPRKKGTYIAHNVIHEDGRITMV